MINIETEISPRWRDLARGTALLLHVLDRDLVHIEDNAVEVHVELVPVFQAGQDAALIMRPAPDHRARGPAPDRQEKRSQEGKQTQTTEHFYLQHSSSPLTRGRKLKSAPGQGSRSGQSLFSRNTKENQIIKVL